MAPATRGKPAVRSGIEAAGLVREYKDCRAVDGLDLAVPPGEIYGFLGQNGAGKSTTVHLLTTLLTPTSGRASVGGHDVVTDAAGVRTVIGAALQDVALDPLMSAVEHVALQGALHCIPKRERRSRGEELFGVLGLTDVATRKVGTYSGGMKRRLDLVLALLHRPSVLFLDEPTNGLDVQSRETLWDLVRTLARDEGVTVFLTTQYLEEADALADRVGILDAGRLVAEATPAQLKARFGDRTLEVVPVEPADTDAITAALTEFGPASEAVTPGAVATRLRSGDTVLADVIRFLDGRGLAIGQAEIRSASLRDVFLAMTSDQRTTTTTGDTSPHTPAPANKVAGTAAPEAKPAGPTRTEADPAHPAAGLATSTAPATSAAESATSAAESAKSAAEPDPKPVRA
jgi:ABC-2 type transport system ATP-binding protein